MNYRPAWFVTHSWSEGLGDGVGSDPDVARVVVEPNCLGDSRMRENDEGE